MGAEKLNEQKSDVHERNIVVSRKRFHENNFVKLIHQKIHRKLKKVSVLKTFAEM